MSLYTPGSPPRQLPSNTGAPASPKKAGNGRIKAVVLALIFMGVVAIASILRIGDSWTDARMMGAPLRVTAPEGDRVLLLTGQWRTKTLTTGRYVSSTTRTTDLFVDLWSFDTQAKPLSRVRLLKLRDGAMADAAILGAVADTLWLYLKGELLGISIASGRLVANPARIESVNPALQGLLPTEHRYYDFDGGGLYFLGLDGRHWRLNSETLVATQAGNTPAPAVPGAVAHAYFTPSSTVSFQSRGLELPGFWLGLLTPDEAKNFESVNRTSHLGGMVRHALWKSTATEKETFFGNQAQYAEPVPLPPSPEFLDSGLLAIPQPTGPATVIWAREPDSVFVLHRDKLGDEGRLRLCRVTGPEGQVQWDVPLPLSVLQSVLPGQNTLMLYGCEYTPAPNQEPRDPMHTAVQRLIAIDLPTGKVQFQDQANVTAHPEATPLESAN